MNAVSEFQVTTHLAWVQQIHIQNCTASWGEGSQESECDGYGCSTAEFVKHSAHGWDVEILYPYTFKSGSGHSGSSSSRCRRRYHQIRTCLISTELQPQTLPFALRFPHQHDGLIYELEKRVPTHQSVHDYEEFKGLSSGPLDRNWYGKPENLNGWWLATCEHCCQRHYEKGYSRRTQWEIYHSQPGSKSYFRLLIRWGHTTSSPNLSIRFLRWRHGDSDLICWRNRTHDRVLDDNDCMMGSEKDDERIRERERGPAFSLFWGCGNSWC